MTDSRTRPTPPLLTALRTATTPAHRALEAMTMGGRILDGTLQLAEYDRLVRWQAAAHRLLEPYAEISSPSYRSESRLTTLPEVTPPALLPDQIGLSDTLPSRLGVAYVLEGGSLGGSLIVRKLRANPSLHDRTPFPFYTWQAERGLAQWRAYTTYVGELELSSAEIDGATRSAVRTFELFGELWRALS